MTTLPDTDRERAEDEAAAWLVTLSEDPENEGLWTRFEEWRTASELNAEIWARTRRAYGLAGEGPPQHKEQWENYAASRDTRRILPSVHRRKDGRQFSAGRKKHVFGFATPRRLVVGAAVAAIAACLVLAVAPDILLRIEADVVTTTAELRSVDLQDGTRVQLSPESAIEIAYTDDVRQVRLIKGEAFFEVRPDATRPFRVTVGDTTATVLGTAFEVDRGEEGATVVVRNGHVHVDDDSTTPPTSEDLSAGDLIRVTWRGDAVRGGIPPDEVATWIGGELIARSQAAGDVVEALRPYFEGAILMQSSTFARRRVSGIYSLRNPETTLRELAASHGAIVRQVSPWLLIVSDW